MLINFFNEDLFYWNLLKCVAIFLVNLISSISEAELNDNCKLLEN